MKVGLFVPCYVDALYPEAGVATYKLLKYYGLEVGYPEKQTCCGQPMANAGFQDKSEKVIETFDELFKDYDYIVAPSASCAAYVRVYYPQILKGKHECVSSKKIMDIVEFLHDVLKVDHVPGKFPHVVSVHNSCHGVRELGLSSPSERHIKPFNKIIDLLQWWMASLSTSLSARMSAADSVVCSPSRNLPFLLVWARTRLSAIWRREQSM